ncbi:hypothetical protein, partial [Variovorax sp. Root411]|uniref:hypothetical protein n=1 Tax=Variovorax sp. Root411 TaxID=1736530 RepID=UPI000700A917
HAVELSETTDVKALMAGNGGRYDIEQDPLWNGQQQRTPEAFANEVARRGPDTKRPGCNGSDRKDE